MKVVAAGAHYTTITVDTEEEVKFSFASTSLSVEATGGDITVALRQGAQAGDDETITVPDGESRMFIHHRMNVDTYYLSGSGTATLYASNMGDVNPFKAGKRGGDSGGDNTHYKGTTTTPLENGSTTNPITIDGESYTAVFGDVVVYGYTEFVFDGTQWSEFGRPFDTEPTSGSTNAVTSDGIYQRTPLIRGEGVHSIVSEASNSIATKSDSMAIGYECHATGSRSFAQGQIASATSDYSSAIGYNVTATAMFAHALNYYTLASQAYMTAIGKLNKPRGGDLFNVGNGTSTSNRSNILEANSTSVNVNGDIQINNVAIPTPYTTMPTITADMLGKIAMYVGVTGSGFTQGCFYVAATDGAAEPTYSWVRIGGGRTETVLYDAVDTALVDVTLSQAYTDYDVLYVGFGFSDNFNVFRRYMTIHTDMITFGTSNEGPYIIDSDPTNPSGFVAYNFDKSDATKITYTAKGSGNYLFIKEIIGIKY